MRHIPVVLSIALVLLLLPGCGPERLYHADTPLEFAQFAYPFASQTAVVNGVAVRYHDAGGTGKPVVLIHGLASNMGFYRYNIPDLSKAGLRVIAIDLPGYGMSAKPFGAPYTLTYYSQIVTGLLDELHIQSAVIVGHSMGGQIAMITALGAPERVSQLVLLSPAGFEAFNEGEGNWMRNAVTPAFVKNTPEDRVRANLTANFYSWNPRWEWMVEERVRMTKAKEFDRFTYTVWRCVGAMLDEPVWNKLDRITTPALVIAGANDNLIPNPYLHGGHTAGVMEPGTRSLKNAHLLLLPESGHMIQMERADEVNKAIIDFCK